MYHLAYLISLASVTECDALLLLENWTQVGQQTFCVSHRVFVTSLTEAAIACECHTVNGLR